MTDGHCEHCADCATDYFPKYGRHADSTGWAWDSKMCPKCAAKAERERIVADIEAAKCSPGTAYSDEVKGWLNIGLSKAATIARGEHLEEK